MGLDFSHCNAHWAYSGFMRFRTRVAAQLGLLDYDQIKCASDPRLDLIEKDPIAPLLIHSDCDGGIPPEQCKTVAPRLRELVAAWPDDYDKQQALELADGMDAAASDNEPLKFK